MRVGGKRRVAVPADKIPPSQLRNVPQDSLKSSRGGPPHRDRVTRRRDRPVALFASILPPGDRRLTVTRFLFLLSFLPYLLPGAQARDVQVGRRRDHRCKPAGGLGNDAGPGRLDTVVGHARAAALSAALESRADVLPPPPHAQPAATPLPRCLQPHFGPGPRPRDGRETRPFAACALRSGEILLLLRLAFLSVRGRVTQYQSS